MTLPSGSATPIWIRLGHSHMLRLATGHRCDPRKRVRKSAVPDPAFRGPGSGATMLAPGATGYGDQKTNHWPSYPRLISHIISPASVTKDSCSGALIVTCTWLGASGGANS
jgi:hypothetical protein